MPEWTAGDFDKHMPKAKPKGPLDLPDDDVIEAPEATEGDDGGETPPAADAPPDLEKIFGADIPSEWKGRSPREIATSFSVMADLARTAMRGGGQPQYQPPPPPTEPIFSEDDVPAGADPKAFEQKLERFHQMRMQPIVSHVGVLTMQNSMLRARMTLPYFARYEQEIIARARTKNPSDLMDFRGWETLHNEVIASHRDEIVTEEQARKKADRHDTMNIERGGSGSGGRPPAKNDNELTAEERNVAEMLGVTPAQYLAQKKARLGAQT